MNFGNMDFSGFTNAVGKLGALGVLVSSFVGGVATYVYNSPDVAQALATFVASATNAPFSWKGAVITGASAVGAKVLANAMPTAPPAK